VRLRGKRVQKFGPDEHTLRLGSDWPVMATLRLQSAGSSMTALNWEPDSSAALERVHCYVRFHVA
jgi:hypothetical protein